MTGIILLLLCIFGELIRKNTPGVALLSSISGIGFTYLALNEYLPVAASPIVSFLPFAIIMLGYFSGGNSYKNFKKKKQIISIKFKLFKFQSNSVIFQLHLLLLLSELHWDGQHH